MSVHKAAELEWCGARNHANHAVCTLGPHDDNQHDWAGEETILGRAVVRVLRLKRVLGV